MIAAMTMPILYLLLTFIPADLPQVTVLGTYTTESACLKEKAVGDPLPGHITTCTLYQPTKEDAE